MDNHPFGTLLSQNTESKTNVYVNPREGPCTFRTKSHVSVQVQLVKTFQNSTRQFYKKSKVLDRKPDGRNHRKSFPRNINYAKKGGHNKILF